MGYRFAQAKIQFSVANKFNPDNAVESHYVYKET